MSNQTTQSEFDIETDLSAASGGGAGAEGSGESSPARRVPVSESIRYRRRAQAAEQRLTELQTQFEQASQQLQQTRQQLESIERRQRIDQMLIESEAVDLEAARLLTEVAVAQMDKADVKLAVEDLRKRKPYLFRRTSGSGGSMTARPRPNQGHDLNQAAQAAADSGDRRDLLRYLRMRRRTV